MSVTKSSLERCRKRGMVKEGEDYKCKVCGSTLMVIGTGRSIWDDRFICSGGGEVRRVDEVYCPICDTKPEPPPYGTGIYESEIC